MTRNHLTYAIVAFWTALFVLSFVVAFLLEPTGDGFTRGLNRISAFLVWQGIAVAVAVPAWLTGRGGVGSGTRWLSRMPAIVHSLIVLLVIGLILAVRFTQPPMEPELPPGPATAPAAVAAVPVVPAEPAVPAEQQAELRQHFVIGDGPVIDSSRSLREGCQIQPNPRAMVASMTAENVTSVERLHNLDVAMASLTDSKLLLMPSNFRSLASNR
jgi:hypothetical protein